MLVKNEIKKVISNTSNNYIDDKTLISQSFRLLGTMFDEVENFNPKKFT